MAKSKSKSKSESKSSATSVHLFATTGRTHGGSHCPGILRYTAAYFSCIDAPIEVKSKAENLFSNRLGRKRGSRSEDESKDGMGYLFAHTSQQKRQLARGTL